MIELRTGLPGAGKTLFALKQVRELAEKESRPVYYFNIAGLSIPGWIELSEDQAREWFTLPAKSIVVLDEAQRIFRPRHHSSGVPPYVAELETHRHRGIDLVLITQHPGLVDANVRKLVGRHRHYVRAFGSSVVVQHEWGEVNGEVDKSRADSLQTTLKHPVEVYDWYKSAEVHTVKRRIPARVVALVVLPLVVIACGWGVAHWLSGRINPPAVASKKGSDALASPLPSEARPASYFEQHRPRVASLAFTAPAFDQVMAVKAAPFPAACVASSSRCKCYTEQGTALEVEDAMCRDIVARGLFDPRGTQGGSSELASSAGVASKAKVDPTPFMQAHTPPPGT